MSTQVCSIERPRMVHTSFMKSPVHGMVTNIIMAESACIQLATAGSTKLTVSLVMLTTKHLFL